MSSEEFEKFRQEHLNSRILSKESLLALKVALDLTKENIKVSCDEMHAHSYTCLTFNDRNAIVYHRLIREIERYQEFLFEMGQKFDSARGVNPY